MKLSRRLAVIAAAFAVAGCAMFKRPAPPPPAPATPPAVSKPVTPRPKPAAPATQAVQPQPAVSRTETCRSLALQRESDARSLGRDAKAQRSVRDETYADCMSNKSVE